MIRLENRRALAVGCTPTDTVALDFDARQKSRQRLTLASGVEAGLLLERGTTLRHGDILMDAAGQHAVQVVAAEEMLSVVDCADRLLLNRVCYHLGNRHVPLQVAASTVAYRHDHVLDDMVAGLGVMPIARTAMFQPEPGAYEGHGHSHRHEEHHHAHG
ncbi:MAG: urease accessory protein UreE [Salinisphaera sp.]|jgi:urease accessory protein|nr:urease accessory protein UreE [Salinisphaera sp.]